VARGKRRRARLAQGVTVALTTTPERLPFVWMTVESLLHQTDVPEHVVLTLDATAYTSRRVPLSVRLRALRGLEVRWDDTGSGPYAALLPLIDVEAPHTVILIDDAHLMPRDLVATLLTTLTEHPRNVVVGAGTAIELDEDGRPTSPADWPKAAGRRAGPRTFPSFAGAVAIPAGVLDRSSVRDLELARSLAPNHPDIWLWANTLRAGVPVRSLGLPGLPTVTHRQPRSAAERERAATFEDELAAVITALGLDLEG
jgi:hypothetical protein